MRVKRGVAARAKHKKILAAAKGMQHYRTRSFRLAKQGVIKALRYAYKLFSINQSYEKTTYLSRSQNFS